jgi:hypothetical protein
MTEGNKYMKKGHIIRSVLAAEMILLIPLIAMFFTEEVDWKVPDFIVVGILLGGVGVAYQLIVTGIKNDSKQAAIGIVLAAAMILIWMELAVGVFGTPFAGS